MSQRCKLVFPIYQLELLRVRPNLSRHRGAEHHRRYGRSDGTSLFNTFFVLDYIFILRSFMRRRRRRIIAINKEGYNQSLSF